MKNNSFLKNSIFRNGIDEHSHLNPFKTALFITISYVVFISLYIVISGRIAEWLSTNVMDLADIELIKGLLYALVTGSVVFFVSFSTLKKIAKKDNFIVNQNKSIISTEPIVMTGIFSASVCHDINNLMTIVVGNINLLGQSKNIDNNDLKLITRISEASTRLIDLVRRMMNSGKSYIPGELKQINLSAVLEETVKFAKVHKKLKRCEIGCEIERSLYFNINSILIERMLMNLMLNAAEATNLTGKIVVKFSLDDSVAILEVHDNGPGIPENMHENIFEPFYTSKEDGNGLGLLSLKICADQHNGTFQVKKSYLGGACFCLTFPVNDNVPKVER